MRKFYLLLFIFCSAVLANAQSTRPPKKNPTTDKIVVSDLNLTPGGDYGYFTVSLEGNTTYTAYGMDLFLPEGFELYYEDNEAWIFMANDQASFDGKDIYPYKKNGPFGKVYTHTFAFSTPSHQQIRVACFSTESAEFTATSGALFHVYVKATPYAKPGKNTIRVEGVELVVREGAVGYHPEDAAYNNFTATAESSVNLNISAQNQYSTCILPFDCALPAGVQAYSCSEVDNANQWLKLTEENSLKAYTPYILYAENGCTATLTGTVNESQYVTSATQGKLTGVITLTQLKEGYVLQNKGQGAKFYKANPEAPFSLRPGRCYLSVPAAANIQAYSFDSTPTGITEISSENGTQPVLYDLQGRLVSEPVSGHIYIVNGNKMLKK